MSLIRGKTKQKKETIAKPTKTKVCYKTNSGTERTKIVYKKTSDTAVPYMKLKVGGLKMTKLSEIHKQISNVQTLILHTNATPIGIRHGARARNYGCAFCENTYVKPADLKTHSLTHSTDHKLQYNKHITLSGFIARLDITRLKCNICDAELPTLEDAGEHLTTVHDKKIFPTASKRVVPFRFEGDDMFCCICNNDYSTFKTLSTHMRVHFRNFVCEVCDAGFITERMLKTHQHSHGAVGTFKCSQCDKEFTTEGKKRRHERIVHVLRGMTHSCAYCGERFPYHGLSVKHLHEKHGIEMPVYKCRACDAEFDAKRKLSRHIKKDHLMEKNFACDDCDMRFFDRDGLKEHQLKHNGKRDYKCPVCLKAYGRKHTLRNHMRIHIDDRRFKCDHCELTFVQKCSLKGHLKSRHNIVIDNQNITPLPSKPLVIASFVKH